MDYGKYLSYDTDLLFNLFFNILFSKYLRFVTTNYKNQKTKPIYALVFHL